MGEEKGGPHPPILAAKMASSCSGLPALSCSLPLSPPFASVHSHASKQGQLVTMQWKGVEWKGVEM